MIRRIIGDDLLERCGVVDVGELVFVDRYVPELQATRRSTDRSCTVPVRGME